MRISGIDEAGLGPILGPYCAALVSLEYRESSRDPRELCPEVLDYELAPGTLAVGDSKKLASSGKIQQLERTVLAFYAALHGSVPATAGDLIQKLSGKKAEEILGNKAPWNKDVLRQALPLSPGITWGQPDGKELKKQLASRGIILRNLDLALVPAGGFNRLLDSCTNKAAACQAILKPLMQKGCVPGGKLIVDRQGGRRYYGEWLLELFPGRLLAARQETTKLSLYQVDDSEISFQVGADDVCFETALASMTAKYVRELYMEGFNRYWLEKLPGLKRTAGYYSDGKRFLSDLEKAGLFPVDPSLLVRKK